MLNSREHLGLITPIAQVDSIGTGNTVLITFNNGGDPLGTGIGPGATDIIYPIVPGSVEVTAGAVTGNDNGQGAITGTGIASGTIDYATGDISVTFDSAPGGAVDISVAFEQYQSGNKRWNQMKDLYGEIAVEMPETTNLLVLGSNDGTTFTTLYSRTAASGIHRIGHVKTNWIQVMADKVVALLGIARNK